MYSSIGGLGTLGYISSASLYSSIGGLGTLGYLSTLPQNADFIQIRVSSLTASTLQLSSYTLFTQGVSTLRLGTVGPGTFFLSSMNVGINCNAPETTFDLAGTMKIASSLTVSSINITPGTLNVTGVTTLSNTSNTGTLNVTGFVGIGKTASYNLDVSGNINCTQLLISGIPFSGSVAGINSSGNIGINKSSNASIALDVSGTMNVSGLTTLSNTSNTGTFGVVGLTTLANTSNTGTLGVAGLTTLSSNVIIQNTGSSPYALDVNGVAQAAIYYSSVTAGGTTTITPNNFGIFYNITVNGTYTLSLSNGQASSNIGKYVCLRNNCGTTLTIALLNATGITSPVTLSNAQSATFVVATTTTYALF